MKINKRFLPFILLITILLIAVCYIYLLRYQSVMIERIRLLDSHCIAVNPLIISRSKAFIDSMNVSATGSAEQFRSYQDQYYNVTKDYVRLEKLWLSQQEAFRKQSDVAFFIPSRLQEADLFQEQMYRTEYQHAMDILQKYRREENFHLRELTAAIVASSTDLRIAHQGYMLKYQNKPQSDFRNKLIRIPQSQCPEENYRFPDIEKELGNLVIGP